MPSKTELFFIFHHLMKNKRDMMMTYLQIQNRHFSLSTLSFHFSPPLFFYNHSSFEASCENWLLAHDEQIKYFQTLLLEKQKLLPPPLPSYLREQFSPFYSVAHVEKKCLIPEDKLADYYVPGLSDISIILKKAVAKPVVIRKAHTF